MRIKTKNGFAFLEIKKWLGKSYGEYFGTKVKRNTEDN